MVVTVWKSCGFLGLDARGGVVNLNTKKWPKRNVFIRDKLNGEWKAVLVEKKPKKGNRRERKRWKQKRDAERNGGCDSGFRIDVNKELEFR